MSAPQPLRLSALVLFVLVLGAEALGPQTLNPAALDIHRTFKLGRVQRLRGGECQPCSPLPISDQLETTIDKLSLSSAEGKATLKISIDYGIDNGVIVCAGPSEAFGRNDVHRAPKMENKGGTKWELNLEVPLQKDVYEYYYVVQSGSWRHESRICHRAVSVKGLKDGDVVDVQDRFRSTKPAILATAAFDRAIFGKGSDEKFRESSNKEVKQDDLRWDIEESGDVTVRFSVYAPRVEAGHSVWVTGKPESMGAWSSSKAVPMVHVGHRIYIGQVKVKKSDIPLQYKYQIADESGNIACSEEGDNHQRSINDGCTYMMTDDAFSYPTKNYRSAGVALPVSGIKTRDSTGIGEFLDLKKVVDWCAETGLQLIQVLPINDSGEDPSPYSASSSFALHPSYIRPSSMCEYYEKKYGTDMSGLKGWSRALVEKLNSNWQIDHPRVMEEKKKLTDAIFDKVTQEKVLEDEDFQKWLKKQDHWVKTYAAFKVQLNKERQFNNKWWDSSTWTTRASQAEAIVHPHGQDYNQVARVYFTQYHLHVQLLEATAYAEKKGVALKGDIPIGVTRCSADVWAEPHLFKLDRNAGAPGDPEQNWGFPPYNWEAMHKDGCHWWRRRLVHMEQYFHAYRIDHILGFFRMWEIPAHSSGGHYVPEGGLREMGLRNLRAIQTASNMLICGEDLGNVPDEVPPVLNELGILGLRIQRWCDGHTWKYDYMSVAAASCHDCSPCRLWWNEEWGSAEGWYNFFIGQGQCPGGPPDWVIQKIIKLHAESTSMWTINPIQDYLDMWESLRSQNCKNDIINRPGQTEGCWVWRCHLRMEKILEATEFNAFLKKMLTEAGRGKAY